MCNGDGTSCLGCDGVVDSGLVNDACGVCNGNGSACAGCDGVPNSGKVYDRCNVCGGDGQSCVGLLRCQQRTDCGQCNTLIGSTQTRYCVWCNSTNACAEYTGSDTAVAGCAVPAWTCPMPAATTPPVTNTLSSNDAGSAAGWIVGIIVAAVLVGVVIGVLLWLRAKGKGPLMIQHVDFEHTPAYENPLYEEVNKPFDNPMFGMAD